MTTRLDDIEVEEVSVVNVPANKKRFLIVKAADGDYEMVPRPEGGYDLVKKGEGSGDSGGSTEDPVKLTKKVKEALLKEATDALGKLTALTEALEGAEETDGAAIPEGVTVQFEAVGKAVEALVDKAKVKVDDKDKKKTEPPKADAEMDTEEKRDKIGKAAETHMALLNEKIEAIQTLAKDIADNAKAMDAKDLRTKLNTLESLGWKINSVAQVVNVNKSDTETEKLVKAAEIRGMTEAMTIIEKMLPSGIEPSTDPTTNAGAGALPPDSGVPALSFEEMLGKIPGLADIAKRIEDLDEKVKKLKDDDKDGKKKVTKSVGLPNSGEPTGAPAAPGFDGWPLDMNKEIR